MDKKYRSVPIHSHEITPESLYMNRREFLKVMGVVGAAASLAACAPVVGDEPAEAGASEFAAYEGLTDELDAPLNTFQQITNFNNYYEFTTDKERVADLAKDFSVRPWTVEVTGLVKTPKVYDIDDLLTRFPQEDRIYRLRCVEAWSMVIPWLGFPLKALLDEVEPTADAQYVAFQTALDQDAMPGTRSSFYPWPYAEGLRLDEAMNDLAILSTGLYGKHLLPQNGAPIRLVVPWKYGFKSIKSIVRIELLPYRPETFWNVVAPNEYGFFANVNPEVDHPRWTQSSERRIGETGRRETLMFNGYAEEVAYLYDGMDLQRNY